jgi:hypothetical protein
MAITRKTVIARTLHCLALAFALGLGGTARAAGDTEQAREHHRAAEAAFEAGRFDEAFRQWEQGFNLSGKPLFLLNMAHAERRRGELRGARALYKRYLVMEPQTKLRAQVEEVLTQIDGALAADEAAKQPAAPPSEPAPLPALTPAPGVTSASPLLDPPGAPAVNLLAAEPAPPAPRPVYKRWWFWAGAGAVVAAGVITTALLLRGDSYSKSGSLGTVGAP